VPARGSRNLLPPIDKTPHVSASMNHTKRLAGSDVARAAGLIGQAKHGLGGCY